MAIPYTATANTKILYHLDGNSTDSSGNANNGTDTGITYSVANGKFGQGAGFVTASNSIISSANNVGITGAGARTIIAWLKCATTQDTWLTFGENLSGKLCALMSFTGHIYFAGGVDKDVDGVTNIVDGAWHCAGLTYDGTTSTVYHNGAYDASAVRALNTTASVLYLGCRVGHDEHLTGQMDEVIIENRCWSATEILAYYNAVAVSNKQFVWFWMKKAKEIWDLDKSIYRPQNTGLVTI